MQPPKEKAEDVRSENSLPNRIFRKRKYHSCGAFLHALLRNAKTPYKPKRLQPLDSQNEQDHLHNKQPLNRCHRQKRNITITIKIEIISDIGHKRKQRGHRTTTQSDRFREKEIPKNADPTRTHLNRVLVEYPDGVHGRMKRLPTG